MQEDVLSIYCGEADANAAVTWHKFKCFAGRVRDFRDWPMSHLLGITAQVDLIRRSCKSFGTGRSQKSAVPGVPAQMKSIA